MKALRSLLVLAFATALAGTVALAEHHDEKKTDAKPAKAACGCETGKDGKECGVDKKCCCTGEKAKGRPEAKKTEEKKSAQVDGAACTGCKA